jgi:VanZ family protein
MKITVGIISILIVLFFIFIICSADNSNMPLLIQKLYDFPGGDKIGHFGLLFVFNLAVNMICFLRRIKLFGFAVGLGSLIVIVFIIIEEFSQIFISSRTFDLIDLFCSILGILAAEYLLKIIISRKREM